MTYRDQDGNECSLLALVKKEPEWAASIIEQLRAAPPSDASHAMLQVQRDGATKAWEREVKRNRGLEAERDRLHAVLKRLWDAGDAYFTHHGAEHEEDCPEDDTCECPLVNAINEAFAAALPLVEDKVSAQKMTARQG